MAIEVISENESKGSTAGENHDLNPTAFKNQNTTTDCDDQQTPDSVNQQCSNTVAPDGGWGWMVVFAAFMIHVVTDGVVYSFGVLYIEFLKVFKESTGLTSAIASILVGTTLCAGPIASAFVNRYGCRPVTLAGTLISSLCIAASAFASSVYILILTLGLGTGIGFGLIYLPAIVSVTVYFDKYRSVATGLGVCGSGFGTIIFSPLIDFAVRTYGWKGTLIVISILVSTCLFYGLLFRPLPNSIEESKEMDTFEERSPLTVLIDENDDKEELTRPKSVHDLTLKTNGYVKNQNMLTVSQPVLNRSFDCSSNLSLKSAASGLMYRKDVFFTASTKHLYSAQSKSMEQVHKVKNTNSQEVTKTKMYKCSSCLSDEYMDTFSEMMDFSILFDPIFLTFAISNVLTSIGYNIPYLYIPIQAENNHVEKKLTSYLLSIVGASNTIGRVILGYLADKPWINRRRIYSNCLIICGLSTCLSIFCHDMYSFSYYAISFGVTTGAYVGLTSVLTVDLFGLDKLTNAFGVILLFQGLASFFGPPMAGWLIDFFGGKDYSPGFILAGVAIGLSGLIMYLIPMLDKSRKNKSDVNCA